MHRIVFVSLILLSLNSYAKDSIHCEADIYNYNNGPKETVPLKRKNLRNGSVFEAETTDLNFKVYLGLPGENNLTYKVTSTSQPQLKFVSRHSKNQIGPKVKQGYDHGKPMLEATLPQLDISIVLVCYL